MRDGLCSGAQTFAFALVLVFAGCGKSGEEISVQPATQPAATVIVKKHPDGIHFITPQSEFILEENGHLRGILLANGNSASMEKPAEGPGITVTTGNRGARDFVRDLSGARISEADGKLGAAGKRVEVHGHSAETGLDELLAVEMYDDFPGLALLSASYKNTTQKTILLDQVTLQTHRLDDSLADAIAKPHNMWAFFGSSLKWGKDDVVRIPAKFSQENPLGAPVNTHDDSGSVGGGIPIAAFWTRAVGLAVGHLETLPLSLSIPAKTNTDGTVEVSVAIPAKTTLNPGDSFATPRTFMMIYHGDYYEPLRMWSRAQEREGLAPPKNNDENYAVSWCGWGYQANVTPKQMTGTIPKLKELGIHWATLDDRWFSNYGDWLPRQDTFGGSAIQEMVKDFHSQGIKVQLWWLPLAVEDGKFRYDDHKYGLSEVAKQHPEWLVLDEKGRPARMARNLATLCPALPEVREYYRTLTERFIRDWDFDGHKLDNIYSIPPCYNPKHHHKSPFDSVNAMGDVYKTIFETTRALKPASVTQICPCGTPPSLTWLRYMDQAVTADPVGAVQVRRRMKMYKALLGPNAAVYGDHVELTRITGANSGSEKDIGDDFASTLGTGGVLGTKFAYPDYGPKLKDVYLNASKEAHWKKWIGLYNEKMLSKGNFLNLYVYGYDLPEAYAIEKDGAMYYAFYAPEPKSCGKPAKASWKGEVELRGLANRSYHVTGYVDGKDYGTATGPTARLQVEFTGSLLLEAR